jgi:homoserine dehydrogenase
MRRVRIAIIGFGNIGRALARVIALKRGVIMKRFNIDLSVVAVADSKGMVIKPEGLNEYELLKLCELPRSEIFRFEPYGRKGVDLEELYNKVQPDIHVELTPPSYENGEPGLTNILFALRRGAHVVTANKAPLALYFGKIMEEARARLVKFGATVMGGSPFIAMLQSMRSHDVALIEGILNATTNFILTEMHENLVDFEQALKKAQALGIAEPNPVLDIEGFDAAAKLAILSHVIGVPIDLRGIERESIAKLTLKDVVEAVKQGYVIKYVATLDAVKRVAYVKLRQIPRSHVLAQVSGTLNGVRIVSDATELFFVGKGGGRVETAHTVLDDIIDVSLR